MNRTLLILCGGAEAVPGIQLAKKMGLFVVVSDNNPTAVAVKFADDFIHVDTQKIDETLHAIEHYNNNIRAINAVLSFSMQASVAVAHIAELLTLPGISVASAELVADKLATNQCLAKAQLRLPWYSRVNDSKQLEEIVAAQGLPLILRAAKQSNACRVLRLTKGVDLEWAFKHCMRHSLNGNVVVEKFIAGQQVSAESLLVDGDVYTPCYCDRNYEYLTHFSPYIIENGGNLPSFLPDNVQDKISTQIKTAAASLGIMNGVIKGDFVVNQLEPYLVGITTGLNGGYFGTHQIPLSTGVNAGKLVIQQALGDPIDLKALRAKFMRAVSQRYLFAEPGRITEISGVNLARDLLCVEAVIIKAKVGDIVDTPIDADSWAAMVIAVGDNRDQANKHAFNALNHITIITEPL
ncbi:MAG: ATP-grasp domain-containing protein [Gammaproteobacteria bacterium]|nr:ATP-grasp domain-containing protein [Gammaproteobacteria bacterium]